MGDRTGTGYAKRSANRLGIDVSEYVAEVSAGRKWCVRHGAFHDRAEFGSDPGKRDGLNRSCRASFRVQVKRYRASRGTTGMTMTAATRERMRTAHLGPRNARWKGGVTAATRRERQCAAYRHWRLAVLSRDGRQCQRCHERPKTLHAHHVRPFSRYPALRYVVSNGVTLCGPCHRITEAQGVARG